MSSQLSRAALSLTRTAGRPLCRHRGSSAVAPVHMPARPCSQCHSVKEWKENHGAWSRTSPAGATRQQTRSCSQCHSVKDWKENHGAWSRAAGSSAVAKQTRACSQCHSVKEWKENHGAWSRTGQVSSVGTQQRRAYASEGRSIADDKIEEITELFNTAKDEFELAYEETEKKTIYAADDRAAAEEEFAKMQEAYAKVLNEVPQEIGDEIQKRIGARIRELEAGMKRLQELAMED